MSRVDNTGTIFLAWETKATLETTGAIESIGSLRGNSVTTDVTTASVPGRPLESLSNTLGQSVEKGEKQQNPKEIIDSLRVRRSGRYRTRICDLNDVNVAL